MTDARLAEAAIELWSDGAPTANASLVAIEQWTGIAYAPGQVLAAIVALEQWAAPAAAPPSVSTQARVMVLA